MSSQINELTWRFNFKHNLSQTYINDFIEEFVFSFVEGNSWYCGGGEYMGMYDPKKIATTAELKSSLLDHLSSHNSIVESITITDFIDSTDSCIDKETILIRSVSL